MPILRCQDVMCPWGMLILRCQGWAYGDCVHWARAMEGMSRGADAAVSGTA
jgi:hypothetical protein